MWETTEINLYSESLRVKRVKTIHLVLATEKKSNYKVFFLIKKWNILVKHKN